MALIKQSAKRLTGNPHDAADLVQNFYLHIHGSVIPSENPAGYLIRCLKNFFLNEKKKPRIQTMDIERYDIAEQEPDEISDKLLLAQSKITADMETTRYLPMLAKDVIEVGGTLQLSKQTGIPQQSIHNGVGRYKEAVRNMKSILIVCNLNGAVGYHRLAKPYSELRNIRDDLFITQANGYINQSHDVVIFNRVIGSSFQSDRAIMNEMKMCGQKIICDVDDWWVLEPGHHVYKLYMEGGLSQRIIQNIKDADIVTTTHKWLADKIVKLNKNVVILPNVLDPHEPQWLPCGTTHPKVRIGYSASASHTHDVPLLAKPLRKIYSSAEKDFIIKLIGYTPHPDWNKFRSIFTAGGTCNPENFELVVKTDVLRYGIAYNFLDCALAPLASTPFNRCKSNLKVLEAAAHGIPIICSDTHPFRGSGFDDVIYFCKSERDWIKWIRHVINNPLEAKARGKAAREIFLKNHTYKNVNKLRSELI